MLHTASDDRTLDTLGGRLRAVRKARRLKIGGAAQQIGVSRTTFSAWEADFVKNPDQEKLAAFVRLADVSLDWLISRKGDDPDLTIPQASRRRRSSSATTAPSLPTTGNRNGAESGTEYSIPEIAAPLSAHAKNFDLTARAFWQVPRQVLEIGFNSVPEATVVKRIVTRVSDGFGFARGDYVFIDTSRIVIDEPGTYIVADPEGKSARRVLVAERDNKLDVVAIGDDLQRSNPQIAVDNLATLGRIMGILKPA